VKQIEFLRFVIDVLEKLDISYAVVGSYASSAWGEPRMTRDIDVIIELSGNEVAALCDAFPPAEFYVSPVAARDAVQRGSQLNVIQIESAYACEVELWTSRRDITGILKTRKDRLELDYIASTAAQLRLSDVWQSIVENLK
jgi:hypothetical protein